MTKPPHMLFFTKVSKFLSVQKTRQIDVLGQKDKPETKTEELFCGLRDGVITTDEEAIKLLYPNEANPNPAYKKIKYRLKEKLINTLFVIDAQQYGRSAYEKAAIRAARYYTAGVILNRTGINNVANSLYESQIKSCIEFGLFDFQILFSQKLKKHYGLFVYNKKKHERYQLIYKKAVELKLLLDKLEDIYTFIGRKILSKKKLVYTEEIKKIEKSFLPLYYKALKIDDHLIRFFAYNCYYFILMFKHDISSQTLLCNQALEYYKAKKYSNRLGLMSFTLKKGLCHLANKEYNKATCEFDYLFNTKSREQGIGWFSLLNYKFSVCILDCKYYQAYEVASIALNHKAFKNARDSSKQQWYIKEAFVHYLIKAKIIDPKKSKAKPIRPLRINRFLNEFQDYNKDKKGLNVIIKILPLLFYILDKDHDKAEVSIKSLLLYSQRYLGGKEQLRPRTFIKMLKILVMDDFDMDKSRQKTNKLLAILMENPIVYTEPNTHIEVMPYERIWSQLDEALA